MTTALITGASSGIGLAFAEELAAQQTDLVLVARSADKLQEIAQRLKDQHQIKTDVIVLDLIKPDAAQQVFEKVEMAGLTIDLLINNAGYGDFGRFSDRPQEKLLNMIQLNITALVALTHLFLPSMKVRGFGSIINVSSIAGYQPLPYMAVYSASKAFVLHFSEALWAENKTSGVKILALCPGATESKFAEVAEFPNALFEQANSNSLEDPTTVVKAALKALQRNRCNQVTGGIGNQIVVNVGRFFPRPWLVNSVAKLFGKAMKT